MDIKNIFQLWDEIGRKVPFKVRRENWSKRYIVIVEKIECEKMPYGKAYGYTTDNGQKSDHYDHDKTWRLTGEIPCAGCYQWYLTEKE